MAAAETTLYRILASSSPLADAVDGRIYQDIIPQPDVLPAVVYSRTSTEPLQTIHGTSVGAFAMLEIQIWAKTRAVAEDISTTIITALDAGGETYESRAALYDDETKCHGSSIEVRILEV